MKHFNWGVLLLFLLLACQQSPQQSIPELANKRVLFLGNSITQNGGYVSFIEYHLRRQFPDLAIDIISIGLGSETVSCLTEEDHPYPRPCLKERLFRALDMVKPQLVFACYGMNDGIYHPQSPNRFQAFKEGIQALLEASQQREIPTILISPPVFDAQAIQERVVDETAAQFGYKTPFAGYDEVLADYSNWMQSLNVSDVRVVDLHGPMKMAIQQKRTTQPDFSFSKDGVHPSTEGHSFMAETILKALEIPTISFSISDYEMDPLFKMVDQRRKLRSDGWLKYVGYTRGETVKQDQIEPVEKAAAELKNEIEQLLHH